MPPTDEADVVIGLQALDQQLEAAAAGVDGDPVPDRQAGPLEQRRLQRRRYRVAIAVAERTLEVGVARLEGDGRSCQIGSQMPYSACQTGPSLSYAIGWRTDVSA
jgi:hypothetical protein